MRRNGYQVNDGADDDDDDDLILTLHAGLAAGEVHVFDVGDATRREFITGGAVHAELGKAEDEAGSREIFMT